MRPRRISDDDVYMRHSSVSFVDPDPKSHFLRFSRVITKPYEDLTDLDKVNIFLWAIDAPDEIDSLTVELLKRIKSDKLIRNLRMSNALHESDFW